LENQVNKKNEVSETQTAKIIDHLQKFLALIFSGQASKFELVVDGEGIIDIDQLIKQIKLHRSFYQQFDSDSMKRMFTKLEPEQFDIGQGRIRVR
jgi:RNA:NAD 2'-phosphotransferase (TPT1/KptA family)